MHRFIVDDSKISGRIITIENEDVNHIKNVLRLNLEDNILICNGENKEYKVQIKSISNNIIKGLIIEENNLNTEPPIHITLYQSLPKSSKMDLIIQKTTELGVKKIVPIITKRTIVKINSNKKEKKKIERWKKISREAVKQCKRGKVPQIDRIVSFDEMINDLSEGENIIVPYESENKVGLKEILNDTNIDKINIVIGPEGGFEESEIDQLRNINAHIVSLGPRILRTETAGFTAISIVMYELGDIGVI